MTSTIVCDDQQIIELDEYIDFCHQTQNLNHREVTKKTAFMLRRLANNTSFLPDFLNLKLRNVLQYDVKTDFRPPSFYLYTCEQFSVRAVLWLPSHSSDEDFSAKGYGVTHNHHFDFLTCGYYGPGYRTLIYQFDSQSVAGLIGERVKLLFREDTLLTPGKLMHYQHSNDVHIQYPPDSLSISINLIFPSHPEASIQSAFDPQTQCITDHLDVLPTTRILMGISRHIHNEETIEVLNHISQRHCCPRTRAMAYSALMDTHPENRNLYQQQLSDDRSRYVRETFLK